MVGTPDVDELPNGNVLVTWLAKTSLGSNLYSSIMNPKTGSTVAEQTLISSYNIDDFASAVLSNGNRAYVLRESLAYLSIKDPKGQHLFSYGAGRGEDFVFSKDFTITALTDGGMLLTFSALEIGTPFYYDVRDSSGQELGGPVPLGVGNVIGKAAVAALPDGAFALAYCHGTDGDYRISLSIVSNSEVNPVPIGPIRADIDGDVLDKEPAITIIEGGYILVTWTQGGAASQEVYARIFDAGGTALAINGSMDPFKVDGDGTLEWSSSAATLSDGSFVLSWTDSEADAEGNSIRAIVQTLIHQSIGDASANTISGVDISDVMFAKGGNDTLFGRAGRDSLSGQAGDDRLDGGLGDDTLSGGVGNDTYVIDNVRDRVREVDGEGFDTVETFVSMVLQADLSIEVIEAALPGSTDALQLVGNGGAQTIIGNAGNNVLSDGGGSASDVLQGGAGNDSYVVRNAGTSVIEGFGGGTADSVTAHVSYSLEWDSEVETLTATGRTALALTGNDLGQTIIGNGGSNVIEGMGGNDVLIGLKGADTLDGGGGKSDTVDYSASRSGVAISLAGGVARGGDAAGDILLNVENVVGSSLDDTFEGDGADNVLTGGRNGGAGDTVSYENATAGVRVTLSTSAAQNTIGAGIDTLVGFENTTGSQFGDVLIGNSGVNLLIGLAGDDVLDGGGGPDVMIGGLGNDTFVFRSGSGVDTIADFASGAGVGDRISLGFGTAFDSFKEILAATTQDDADAVITIDATNKVILLDVLKTSLNADDFLFF